MRVIDYWQLRVGMLLATEMQLKENPDSNARYWGKRVSPGDGRVIGKEYLDGNLIKVTYSRKNFEKAKLNTSTVKLDQKNLKYAVDDTDLRTAVLLARLTHENQQDDGQNQSA